MNLDALFARIHQAVDEVAYLTPVAQVDPNQRAAMADILRAFESPPTRRGSARRSSLDAIGRGESTR